MKKIILQILITSAFLCSCTKEEQNYTITEEIFQFDNNSDIAHKKVNEMLCMHFLELKSEILKDSEEYKNEEKETGVIYPHLELQAKTEVFINTQKFFSARNDFYIYTGGGHGNCMSEGFNVVFNENGNFQNLKLLEVFSEKKKSDFAKAIIKKLRKTYPDGFLLDDIKTDDDLINSIDGFVIKADCIEIFFKKYSVACGATGTAPITFTFEEIKNFVIKLPQFKD